MQFKKEMMALGLVAMATFGATQPALAMPKYVRMPLKVLTYIPSIVIGFKVGTVVGAVGGAVGGAVIGEQMWAAYWAIKDLEAAKKAQAKKDREEASVSADGK